MPGSGHKFYFVGKVPLIFSVVLLFLFLNTFLMLLLEFAGKYFVPEHTPSIVSWYSDRSLLVQFVLLGLLTAILVIFRKRVHYDCPKE